MTMEPIPKRRMTWRAALGLFAVFSGLCTIFVLVVSLAEGWQEHLQAQWPQANARIQRCQMAMHHGNRRSETWNIECRISYLVGDEEIISRVASRSVPSSRTAIWQYPPNQDGQMQHWVDTHPHGTPMAVRYDPADHRHAVIVETDMPRGGPHTPDNLKLLTVCAVAFVVLFTLARLLRE